MDIEKYQTRIRNWLQRVLGTEVRTNRRERFKFDSSYANAEIEERTNDVGRLPEEFKDLPENWKT